MLTNFANYATIAMNIRDKAKLLMTIKDELIDINS